MSRHHELLSTPETIHWGYFDAAIKPVLRINEGDRVTFRTVNGGIDVMPPAPYTVPPQLRSIHLRCAPKLVGHILTGPVYVEGARPGDALVVHIEQIEIPVDWGYNVMRPLRGSLPDEFPFFRALHFPIDKVRGIAKTPWGIELPLSPFFGVMGTAPRPAYGSVSTMAPREFGGNIDLKELTPGAILTLPVFNDGALFSTGDGHALQGDGEVNLAALEVCLDGTFEFRLQRNAGITFPRAETPTHWITFGFNEDLDDAAAQALREMIKLLGELRGLAPVDAYALCSLAVDLRITQLVDGNKGVHAMAPKTLFS
jgi:acetamidase/formamidase